MWAKEEEAVGPTWGEYDGGEVDELIYLTIPPLLGSKVV